MYECMSSKYMRVHVLFSEVMQSPVFISQASFCPHIHSSAVGLLLHRLYISLIKVNITLQYILLLISHLQTAKFFIYPREYIIKSKLHLSRMTVGFTLTGV